MCAAYGYVPKKDWATRFDVSDPFGLEVHESYNIRPTKEALVIVRNSPNAGKIMKFGYKAPWNEKMLLLNAKAEGINEKPAWKKMFRERRCLIPASFYVEWQKLDDFKQPWAFSLSDDEPFAFAGMYTENDEFVIITCEPVEDFYNVVHPRQPVILSKKDEDTWLNHDASEESLLSCLVPPPSKIMKKWRISSLVNKATNDFPEIIKEAT